MVTLKSLDKQIQFTIDEGQNLLLGRLLKCDIVLEDRSISSQHARLKLTGTHLRVVDMDSTNGTRLNYSLLSGPAYLQDGDTIEFGNITFIVDGPHLDVPSDPDPSAMTLTSLEPVDASQKLEDTMTSIDVPEEELTDLPPTQPVSVENITPPEKADAPPVLGYILACVLLLLSGLFLLIALWDTPYAI